MFKLRLRLEKRWILAAAVGVLFVLCIVLFHLSLSLRRDLRNLKAQREEIVLLKQECLSLKTRIEAVERKGALTQVGGIVQAFDEVFRSLGLKQKLKYVKPLGAQKMEGARAEEAEVEVQGVNMNEIINILFKIESAPMILSVRKATFKTSFDNAALLNLTMTIALVVAE